MKQTNTTIVNTDPNQSTVPTKTRTVRTLDEQIADAKMKAAAAIARAKELEAKHANSKGHRIEIANNINRKLQAVMDDIAAQKAKLDTMSRKDNPVLYAAQQSRICSLDVKRLEYKKALKDCGAKPTKTEKINSELSMTNLVKLSISHSKDTITY